MLKNGQVVYWVKSVFLVAFLKCIAALSSFIFSLVIARYLSKEEAGLFFVFFTLLTVLSGLLKFGFDLYLVKALSTTKDQKIISQTTTICIILVALLSLSFCVFFYWFTNLISFDNDVLIYKAIPYACLLAPFLVVIAIISSSFQGVGSIFNTVVFQRLLYTILFVPIFLTLGSISSIWAFDSAFYALLLSVFLVTLASIFVWERQQGFSFIYSGIVSRTFIKECFDMWLSSSMILVVLWSSSLIAVFYLSAEEYADYSVSNRLAQLVSFVLMITNVLIPRKIAKFWKSNDTVSLVNLVKKSTRVITILTLIPVSAFIYKPEFFLMFFGGDYVRASDLLVIMTVGNFFNVCCGSVAYILNMTGYHSILRKVSVVSGVVVILITWVLISQFGVKGAAFSLMIGLIVQNLSAFILVKIKLNFWPI